MNDERMLRRIRALLAKAESTAFEEEAIACTAKAHELMTAHAIDRMMIEAREGRGEILTRVLRIDAPYARNKVSILSAAASPNHCRVIVGVQAERLGEVWADPALHADSSDVLVTIVGHAGDIDDVETLFTSLLVQATNLMLQEQPHPGEVRSFRAAFLVGFANAVHRRLRETTEDAVAAAGTAGRDLLPVLASRHERVEAEVQALFPSLGRFSTSISNGRGLLAGRRAGDRADVGHRRVGSTPALPR